MKNPRPLLYTNMTPTKTLIPSEPLNLAFKPGADLLGYMVRVKNAIFAPKGLTEIPKSPRTPRDP